jgi:TonB-dependent SusC/RagA subfamily outer membrane receptor
MKFHQYFKYGDAIPMILKSSLVPMILTVFLTTAAFEISRAGSFSDGPGKKKGITKSANYKNLNFVLKEIRGTVRDSAGILPGATISIKGDPKIGTVTDPNGKFILEIPDNAVLIVAMVGYLSQEVPTAGKTSIDVLLKVDSKALEEVVVVAFGKQKKSDVIGAVSSVNVADLKIPSSNLTTALAGRVAGMIAYQRSGEPGADNADFFIRGVTTFGYKKDPLILLDGVEVDRTTLARLQPDDIASFSIAKDATATSLYGARGANGVVLITTKEGKEGQISISVRMENSVSAPTRNIELADPVTYMRMGNAFALSEVFWSQKSRMNWDSFVPRMEAHFGRYDIAQVNYARSAYDAVIKPVKDTVNKVVRIALDSEIKKLDIYYTFDNTYPDNFSPKYKDTLLVPIGADHLRVLTYRNNKPLGKMITVSIKDLEKRAGM